VPKRPFGARSRHCASLDHLVGASEQLWRHGEAEVCVMKKEKDAVYSLATFGDIVIGTTSDCVSSGDCSGQPALD
jgi:hypothetical protein